jgi:hypothetical protein
MCVHVHTPTYCVRIATCDVIQTNQRKYTLDGMYRMMCVFINAAGVFKAPDQVDIFVDLKRISQLYSTEVTCLICTHEGYRCSDSLSFITL